VYITIVADHHRPCRAIAAACAAPGSRVYDHVVAAAARWRTGAITTNEAFTATRLRRERAIRNAAAAIQPPAFQPGLFDRRAERARLEAAAVRARAADTRDLTIATLERRGAPPSCTAALLLVLHPSRC
jgi:hypothetical protein